MKRKVVADTNVLVSALLSSHEDSATVRILSMVLDGFIIPVMTEDIFKEYGEVLSRKKFGFPATSVATLLEAIMQRAIMINPDVSEIELPDDKDRPFLDAMLSGSDIVLITGNLKHFPPHNRIMTARTFLEL